MTLFFDTPGDRLQRFSFISVYRFHIYLCMFGTFFVYTCQILGCVLSVSVFNAENQCYYYNKRWLLNADIAEPVALTLNSPSSPPRLHESSSQKACDLKNSFNRTRTTTNIPFSFLLSPSDIDTSHGPLDLTVFGVMCASSMIDVQKKQMQNRKSVCKCHARDG